VKQWQAIFVVLALALGVPATGFSQDKAKADDKAKQEAKAKQDEKAKQDDKGKSADKGKADSKGKSDDKGKGADKGKAADQGKSAEVIDVNSATAAQLMTLDGIGEARAKAIIAGRPYRGKNDLVDKKIIPQGVYDKIKDRMIAHQNPAKK